VERWRLHMLCVGSILIVQNRVCLCICFCASKNTTKIYNIHEKPQRPRANEWISRSQARRAKNRLSQLKNKNESAQEATVKSHVSSVWTPSINICTIRNGMFRFLNPRTCMCVPRCWVVVPFALLHTHRTVFLAFLISLAFWSFRIFTSLLPVHLELGT